MKSRAILLSLFWALWFSTTVVSQPRAKLSIPRLNAVANGTVVVPILATTDSLIGLAQFVIEYDSTVVRLFSPIVTIGSDLSSFTITATNERLPFLPQSSGTNKNLLVQISGNGSNFFTGSMIEMVRLNFMVSATVIDSTPVNFDPVINHTFLVTANLNSINGGSIEFENGVIVIGDVEAPAAFDLLSPPDSSWTSAPLPTFHWSPSSDAGSGLATYQLFVDGILNLDNISPSVTFVASKDTLGDGNHPWYVRAVDQANNARVSNHTWVVRIDRSPPISKITRPIPGERINGSEIIVEGEANDRFGEIEGIGVSRVLVSTDGGATWVEATNTGMDYSTWNYVWQNVASGSYILKSKAVDKLGHAQVSEQSIDISVTTEVDAWTTRFPSTFAVSQNYPNPFNLVSASCHQPGTEIRFQIPARDYIVLRIFNIKGEMVRTLLNDFEGPGFYTVKWDGRDTSGLLVASGIYFYQVIYGKAVWAKQMLLVR